jgi:hypothetical protein
MKIANFNQVVASFLYSVAQIAQGLFFHPYQTMQSLVRERVFFWLTLLPTAIWLVTHLIWRLAIVPVVRLVFSCAETGLFACQLIPLFSSWLFYFCLFWQVVLLYLFFRFLFTFSVGPKTS